MLSWNRHLSSDLWQHIIVRLFLIYPSHVCYKDLISIHSITVQMTVGAEVGVHLLHTWDTPHDTLNVVRCVLVFYIMTVS
jgi:hypothetical protein